MHLNRNIKKSLIDAKAAVQKLYDTGKDVAELYQSVSSDPEVQQWKDDLTSASIDAKSALSDLYNALKDLG